MKQVMDVVPLKTMTVREVSAYLQIHPVTTYRMVAENRLPYFRIGNRLRFRQEQIDKMLGGDVK
jgi:excisionase family DNA binding protein